MSFRTWLARKLLPALPKVIEPPTPYEVERMTDLVRLAQAEGRPFAPIPVEWIAALLADRERAENPLLVATINGPNPYAAPEAEVRYGILPADPKSVETRIKIRRREPVLVDDAYAAMGLPRPDEVFAAIQDDGKPLPVCDRCGCGAQYCTCAAASGGSPTKPLREGAYKVPNGTGEAMRKLSATWKWTAPVTAPWITRDASGRLPAKVVTGKFGAHNVLWLVWDGKRHLGVVNVAALAANYEGLSADWKPPVQEGLTRADMGAQRLPKRVGEVIEARVICDALYVRVNCAIPAGKLLSAEVTQSPPRLEAVAIVDEADHGVSGPSTPRDDGPPEGD